MDDYMQRARAELKRVFGYAEFRPGQERAISRILSGGDLLAILPTGGGKSICYQIPAMIADGLTLVISPLISLMKDQVDQLAQLGVPAGALNSSIDAQRAAELMNMACGGKLKLLYIAPERLDYDVSRAELWRCDVRRVIVDEAHCVSQWGHDFRPSYLGIAKFISGFEHRPVVGAFTATATDRVCRDIEELLELRQPELIKTGYDRPNLEFSVVHLRKSLRTEYIQHFIEDHAGQSGIVYCSSRRDTEALAHALGAACYHAGMSDEARRNAQEAFINDDKYVICATNAFGMGIDKPNVRYVIHYHMPASIEAYWQEAGRAGRDGMSAECVLLSNANDYNFWVQMINRDEADEAEKDKRRQRLRQMAQYTHQSGCLRKYLVGYFGESIGDCGKCSNCCAEEMFVDMTREAQMVLSAVKRCNERLGKALIARVLNGSRDKRIIELGFDRQSTYGLMRNMERARITDFIDELISQGYLKLTDNKYALVKLTERSIGVLRGQESVRMRVQTGDEYSRKVICADSNAEGRSASSSHKISQSRYERDKLYGDPLFERLRKLRRQIADQLGVPAFIVFGDSTLVDMTRKLPVTRSQLLNVNGVGEQKLARFGERFIAEIRNYLSENGGISELTDEQHDKDYPTPRMWTGSGTSAIDESDLNPDMMKYFQATDDVHKVDEGNAEQTPSLQDLTIAQNVDAVSGQRQTERYAQDSVPVAESVPSHTRAPSSLSEASVVYADNNASNRKMRRMASDLMLFVRTHSEAFLNDFPYYDNSDVEALCAYIRRLGAEHDNK